MPSDLKKKKAQAKKDAKKKGNNPKTTEEVANDEMINGVSAEANTINQDSAVCNHEKDNEFEGLLFI